LNTTTPSGLSHDKGVRFHRCARQGFKKSAKKLLKTKNDQNNEKGHQSHDCCRRCCSEKSGGETGNAVGFKNALAKFLVIFTLKRSRLSSQDSLLCRDDAAVHATTSDQIFKRRRRCKDDPLPALMSSYRPSGLVFVSQSEVRAG
jgi:hypothetical protein